MKATWRTLQRAARLQPRRSGIQRELCFEGRALISVARLKPRAGDWPFVGRRSQARDRQKISLDIPEVFL